jgi:hypothetical protein
MLDKTDAERNQLTDAIASLPCEIGLPREWWQAAVEKHRFCSGPADQRRFMRRPFFDKAALHYLPTFPTLRRPQGFCRIYTVDLSRGGLCFLHSGQLFPQERVTIVLGNGRQYVVEVRRCRRMQAKCFEIGARFLKVPKEQNLLHLPHQDGCLQD